MMPFWKLQLNIIFLQYILRASYDFLIIYDFPDLLYK